MLIRKLRDLLQGLKKCFYAKALAVMLVSFSVLSGCDGGGCIYADDWGDKIRINVSVPANKEITNTGVTVYEGEPLFMRVGGLIDLCPDSLTIGPNTYPTSIRSNTPKWQNSGYRVSKDDFITILIDGSYQDITGKSIKDGRGLYAVVSDVDPNTIYNDDWWYGKPKAETLNSSVLKTALDTPDFFEMWNNGTVGSGAGYMGKVSGDLFSENSTHGFVWFKYARTANPGDNKDRRQLSDAGNWHSRWSPWKGFWSWGDPDCTACRHEFIATTCISGCAGTGITAPLCIPICIGGMEADCNNRELSPGQKFCENSGAFGSDGGSWCGDDYNGQGSSGCYSWPKNSGGYDITLGAGCPGRFGKYLYAYFANGNNDSPSRKQLFSPAGCDPTNRETCVPVFRDGRPVYQDVPHLERKTPNMSMYYIDNKDFLSNGQLVDGYRSPYTGRLWFKIQDDEFKPSDLVTTKKINGSWEVSSCGKGDEGCCIGPAECVDSPHVKILTDDGKAQRPLCNSDAKDGYTRFRYDDNGNELGNCRPARGYMGYSDNIGSYDVYVETTKIGSGFSAFLTGLINSIRGILFGECMTDENVAQQSCHTQGYCMNDKTGKESCEEDFGGSWVDGVGCTDGSTPCTHDEKLKGCSCSSGSFQSRSSVDYKYYCRKLMNYDEQKCSNIGMIFSGGECVFDTRITSGECVENGGTWVPNRQDWKPGITQKLYTKFIANSNFEGTNTANPFLNAVRASLLLYIVIFAFFYMLGMIETPQREFVVSIFRLAIIVQLIGPNSWEFFHSNLFTIFTDGMSELIMMVAGQFMGVMNDVGDNNLIDPITGKAVLDGTGVLPPQMYDEAGELIVDSLGNPAYGVITEEQMRQVKVGVDDPFSFANQTIAMFFSPEVQKKLMGLLFSMFPIGIIYVIFIWWGMFTYVFAIIKAAILYILAMIAISLLLVVAPIFISFMLFKRTRDIFEKWIMSLVNFLFQPVLVLTALALFNVFVYSALYMTLHYDVCWGCVLHAEIPLPGLDAIRFCVFWGYTTWGGAEDGAIPMGFHLILILLIMTSVAYKMNDWMAKIAAELTTGDVATSLSKTAGAVTNQLYSGVASVGQAAASKAMEKAKGAIGNKGKGKGKQREGVNSGKSSDKSGGDKEGSQARVANDGDSDSDSDSEA